MLPSELLIYRVRKGKVRPLFAPLDEGNRELASEVIAAFSRSTGKKLGGLLEVLDELEESTPSDHRFVRGLKTLLLRRCDFEVQAKVDPFEARKAVFEEAEAETAKGHGGVLCREDREKVLARAAEKLGVSTEDLEGSLWADQEEETVLRDFRGIEPWELLRAYNLSLAQTMLFKAMGMEIHLDRSYKGLFFAIKRLGLMYAVERRDGDIFLHVEGPVSLLKMTERYGTALAKLLPAIVRATRWRIKAAVVLRSKGWNVSSSAPRVLDFEMDDGLRDILPGVDLSTPAQEPLTFDSTVEERFAEDFLSRRTGWELKREPEPLIAGNSVFIPDFGFEMGGQKVFLEIVGFWTEEYLKKKLAKLRHLEGVNLILAIDKKLACSGFEELKGVNVRVVYYERQVPLKEIFQYLKRFEERAVEKERTRLTMEGGIRLSGDVVRLDDVAREMGTSYEAVRRSVEGVEGYVLLGSELISLGKLQTLKERLALLPAESRYKEVTALFVEEGVTSVDQVLDHLGYEVRWHTLDPESVVVIRR